MAKLHEIKETSIAKPDFKYDVAFSFLDADESLARQLAELLTPLSTFVYSEQQLAVAATDGVDTFSSVFRRDARIVVVLYRWSARTDAPSPISLHPCGA